MSTNLNLVLASQSKYRSQLLSQIGLNFTTISPDIDESPYPNEDPMHHVLRLAKEKALAHAHKFTNHLIIGADIVTILDNKITGKPVDHTAAVTALQHSSGNIVTNLTGVCVANTLTGETKADVVITKLKFKTLSLEQIHRYIEKEQPFDNAGSFRFQGLGIALLEEMQTSDPTAIIGLPLIKLTNLLAGFGFFVV